MIRHLGLVFIPLLMVALAGCEEKIANSATDDKKITTAVTKTEKEESSKPQAEVKELNVKVAKDFYELFSKKLINFSNSVVVQPADDFFAKPQEIGFYYGLTNEALYQNAAEETGIYNKLLTVYFGKSIDDLADKHEKQTYTLAENADGKVKLVIDYELFIGDRTLKEKREIVIKLIDKQLKIERFDILDSPIVEILKKANKIS